MERYEEMKRHNVKWSVTLEINKSYGEFWGVWLVKSGACVDWGRVNRAWAVQISMVCNKSLALPATLNKCLVAYAKAVACY